MSAINAWVNRRMGDREMLIEDVEFMGGYASLKLVVRFDESGPYLHNVIDMATGKSLALPSAWLEPLERVVEERYAPRSCDPFGDEL